MNILKPVSLALMMVACGSALAANCSAEIEGNDAMQFNKTSMTVPTSCKDFTVKLTHTGKLPKAAMGHDWVLTKAADMGAVDSDGLTAGLANNYIKTGDTRVIAHTKIVGGGESDSVTFPVSKLKAGESYMFFCSFPGHWTTMKGTLVLTK